MNKNTALTFKRGFTDGIPISLGYLSVSFAFGMVACEKGLPFWAPVLISSTSFTGTGQFVGVDLLSAGALIFEFILTLAIINARYFLMSISLSQRLSDKMTLWQRLIIAFGNTDEVFAVSMGKCQALSFKYMLGLILSPYLGWVFGTFLGTVASGIVPASVTSALGITLYAMFLAIIIPVARESRPISAVIVVSILISCIFNFVSSLKAIGTGWIIIISGISAAAFGALLFPMEAEDEGLE